ncbi:MAG: uracil-DNA glycosylase [Verrucomicrobiia bacterium]
MPDLNNIIDETIQALEDMKRSGVTHVAVSRQTLEALGKAPRRSAVVGPLPSAGVGSSANTPREGTRPTTTGKAGSGAVDNTTAELAAVEARAKVCVKCGELSRCRHSVVFGVGNARAEIMFVGEAPGRDEDMQGEPFVGRAGELLTKIIAAMGFKREDVYIANVLKCRPPENRTPLPDEVTNCLPYLVSQIELIQPKVIVALGATAVRGLIDVQLGITKMRGHWYTFRDILIMPTFHPAYLLRNPPAKKEVWEDMKAVLEKLGRKVPPAKAK